MLKKLLALLLCFQLIGINVAFAKSEKKNYDECSDPQKYKSEADKNKCLTEKGVYHSKVGSWDSAGQSALEILTFLLITVDMISFQGKNSEESNGKSIIYFARSLTPYLVKLAGLAYVAIDIIYYFKFKNACKGILDNPNPNEQFASYADKGINPLCQEVGKAVASTPTPTPAPGATPDYSQVNIVTTDQNRLSQSAQFCKAHICNIEQKKQAENKLKWLNYVKTVYISVAALELTNIIINIVTGTAKCSGSYGTACDDLKDYLSYAVSKDFGRANKSAFNNRNKNDDYLKTYIVQNEFESKMKNVFSQAENFKSDLDLLLVMNEYQRFAENKKSSISIENYNLIKSADFYGQDKSNKLKDLFVVVKNNIGIPKANADTNPLVTLGVTAAITTTLLLIFKNQIKEYITKFMEYPLGRIALYGATGGLIALQTNHIKKKILPALDERSNLFSTRVTELSAPDAIPTPTVTIPAIPTIETPTMDKPKKEIVDEKFKTCLKDDMSVDQTCACVNKKNCNQVKEVPNFKLGDIKIPNYLEKMANQLKDSTNAYSSGNSVKGEDIGNGLLAHENAANGLLKKMKEQYAAESKKANQPFQDIDKLGQKTMSDLLTQMQNAAGKDGEKALSNPSTGALMAAVDTSKTSSANDVLQDIKSSILTDAGGAPAGAGAGMDLTGLGLEAGAEDLGLGGESLSGDEKVAGLDAYEFKEEDINKKSDGNIFDNISQRYLKTAYPRFLKEIKEEAPAKK